MNKLKGIILAVILSLASIMMPFSVYADTITNSNVNINYYLDSVTETASGSYMQTYKVEFIFDQSYLGWISSKMVGTYIIDNNVPITTSQFTKTQAIYVNGAIAETSFTIVTQNTQNGGALQSLSQSIQNSNVIPLADLSTLDDILNVLNDINSNIEIDVIQELENIVANTSLANDYLDIISKFRQWNIPIESFSANYPFFVQRTPKTWQSVYTFNYPLYDVSSGIDLCNGWNLVNEKTIYIFGTSTNLGSSNYSNYFEYSSNVSVIYEELPKARFSNYKFFKVTFTHLSTGSFYFRTKNDLTNLIHIYLGSESFKNVSTEFALQWGLSNDLLDNIQIIANGTTQSNSAASDLESGNSQMASDMDDLATIESGYNQQFNNQLQQIDFTSPIQNNSGILPAANFVITIFNGLINNNPFSVLIIVICILLIGKKVIGI